MTHHEKKSAQGGPISPREPEGSSEPRTAGGKEPQEETKPAPGDFKKELEAEQKKAQEYLDGWKMAQADYINLKRRIENDIRELAQFSNADLITKILPVLENFRRAFRHIPKEKQEDEWVKGIKQVEKQLEDTLKGEGLERIEVLGKEFDPNICEAVAYENSKTHKDCEIIEVIENGYKLKDKILKPAKVKVCKK